MPKKKTTAPDAPAQVLPGAPAAPADLAVVAGRLSLRRLDELLPYARNARTHSEAQVKELAAGMQEFGYTNAVLADSRGIVAGHGRVMAATLLRDQGVALVLPDGTPLPLGYIPTVDCEGWTETKRRAYILADNKLALNSGWDLSMLKLELAELSAEDYDLSLTGFHTDELAELFTDEEPEGNKDPDEVPDLPATPHSKMGDIWICGPHRVSCGDSTKQEYWDALMQGEKADVQFCDPPYGVAYESKLAGKIQNDNLEDGAFYQFLLDFYLCSMAVMKEGAAMYVFHADTEGLNFRSAFKAAGFKLSGCLVWRKDSLVLGRSDFQWQHEPALYGWKPGSSHKWYGGRKQTTIIEYGESGPISQLPDGRWQIKVGDNTLIVDGEAKIEEQVGSVFFHPKPKRSAEHPTMKPVGLVERFLKNSARRNDIVIDGFGGSGSTLMAAERLGMVARTQEFDPKFVDVIVRRWQNYSGRRALHAVTGEPFPDAPSDTSIDK